MQIHFATINGGLEIQGGSGPLGGPFDVTFNAIEDNQINGGVTIEGYDGFWQGFIRNRVNGAVVFDENVRRPRRQRGRLEQHPRQPGLHGELACPAGG